MDNIFYEEDCRLLYKDRFTFQVLQRIMRGNCKLKLTDHRNYVLCYSTPPFPIWIWTENGIGEDTKETIWAAMEHYNVVNTEAKLNVKYEFAEYLANKAKEKILL